MSKARILSGPIFACTVLLMSLCLPALADQPAAVTYLSGKVEYRSSDHGPWQPLQKTTPVRSGDTIRTGRKGIVELTLPDRSILRLAPGTALRIDASLFPANQPRRFSARLLLGKLWARVAGTIGKPGGSFRTFTATAVAGVRGTTYDLRAAETRATDIWVYEGQVAVGPPVFQKDAPREQVPWPAEVSEQQWEVITLGKLQKLHIGADGKPDKPAAFEPEKEKDDWAAWNLERDRGRAAQ